MSKPKIEIGPPCPRCKCEDTTRERNFGKPVKDGRWWCMKCGHLWFSTTIKVYALADMQAGLQLIEREQYAAGDLWVAREMARIKRRVGYTVILIH